jgi:hypothetical protein
MWSTEQTPDTPMQHGTALSKKEVEAVYGTVNNDATLAKHNASVGGHAEESTYFENSRVTLRDVSFNDIGQPGVWFDDQTLGTAFDALERLFRCEDNRIALFNMGFAWQLYLCANVLREDFSGMEELVAKAQHKDFIIIPISDGWEAMFQAGRNEKNVREMKKDGVSKEQLLEMGIQEEVGIGQEGNHWSVMVVDCRERIPRTHYFDSDGIDGNAKNHFALFSVLESLSQVLENIRPGHYEFEANLPIIVKKVPNQWKENACTTDKAGACGPFVSGIAKEVTQYIVEYREDAARSNTHAEIEISLPVEFVQRWNWDSQKTRNCLKQFIERERKSRICERSVGTVFQLPNSDAICDRDEEKKKCGRLFCYVGVGARPTSSWR